MITLLRSHQGASGKIRLARVGDNECQHDLGVYGEYAMLEGRLTHRLAYENTRHESTFNGGAPTLTRTEALKYRLSFGLDGRSVAEAGHLLNLLLETEKDSSSSNPLYGRESTSPALEYRGSFADLAAEARAVIVSLHDLGLAARHCTRLIVVDKGGIAADGSPQAVLTPALVRDTFGVSAFLEETASGFVFQPLDILE
jgi:hypothetical protein